MPLPPCYYCGAPSAAGYPDFPHSCHCRLCSLTHALHTSAGDAIAAIRASSSPEQLRRAIAHESDHHGPRKGVRAALERRHRRLASPSPSSPASHSSPPSPA